MDLSSVMKPMLCSGPILGTFQSQARDHVLSCCRSPGSSVQRCQLPTVVSIIPFPTMIDLPAKILLPHPPHASNFAFIVLLTGASPSLCAQLESAEYPECTGERNLGARDLSSSWPWVSVTNPGMQVRTSESQPPAWTRRPQSLTTMIWGLRIPRL